MYHPSSYAPEYKGKEMPTTVHTLCDFSQIGRFVRLQRPEHARDSSYLSVCEVHVYGYLFHGMVYGTSMSEKSVTFKHLSSPVLFIVVVISIINNTLC